jgi:sec-independent protein translocase protein TatA
MFESPWHWAVVAIVAFILFFGWKNLPDMSRSLGRSLRIFKTEIKGMGQDDKERAEADAPKAIDPPPAQVVRNPAASGAPSRPRPAPRPAAASSSGEARQAGQ